MFIFFGFSMLSKISKRVIVISSFLLNSNYLCQREHIVLEPEKELEHTVLGLEWPKKAVVKHSAAGAEKIEKS